MRIKICGIGSLDEARMAIDAGADALGFNAYPSSPRYLAPERAQEIAGQLSESVLKVVVTVLGSEGADSAFEGFDVIQVHGAQAPGDLAPFRGRRVWVAVKGTDEDVFSSSEIIVDPSSGRGRRADWNRLAIWRRSFILAGGLTPENVDEAITTARPSGVDVCSGVEAAPGRKDAHRVRCFVAAARDAFERREKEERN